MVLAKRSGTRKKWKNLAVYVLNLDRSPERMKRMTAKLKRLGLPFKRIVAVDGKTARFTRRECDERKYELAVGKKTTPTEIGCFVSHYNTLSEFLDSSSAEFALVMEDDMDFADDFSAMLGALLARGDWDMVKLNGRHGGGYVWRSRLAGRYDLVKNLFHQSDCGAYVMNKKAARSYVGGLYPMFVPIDHEFVKFWKYGLRGFCVDPFPTRSEGSRSTIDYAALRAGRRPWYRKLPTALYKSFIALRRAVYVVSGK